MAATRVGSLTPQDVWRSLRKDWLVIGSAQTNARTNAQTDAQTNEQDWRALVDHQRRQLESVTVRSKSNSRSNSRMSNSRRPMLLLAEADPAKFLASFWAALLTDWDMALANPCWGRQEWQSVCQLISPTLIWGTPAPAVNLFGNAPTPTVQTEPAILIPTGGTSGQVKLVHHTWSSLTAAVFGFYRHFRVNGSPVNAFCVLPLYHVSGLMQALRTALSNGQLHITHSKSSPLSVPLSGLPAAERSRSHSICLSRSFISLVPTQLERLLRANQARWLRRFRAVLLGGAPCWPTLLNRAICEDVPICLSYGMTETAAMVTATAIGRAATGLDETAQTGSGVAMPHATVCIEDAGKLLPSGKVGQIVVRSAAIAHGYYNASSPAFATNTFYTDDLGYIDAAGCLRVTGRISGKIISGGENIFPADVEAALRWTGQVSDVCVFGLPHPEWGEIVAAAYVPASATVSPESLKAAAIAQLSRYKHPKQWFALQQLPRNAQGKLNRSALIEQVSSANPDYRCD